MNISTPDFADFLSRHQLPASYAETLATHFVPLADRLARRRADRLNSAADTQQKPSHTPLLVGINGAQGSGKSTLASALVEIFKQRHQLNAIDLSIDDFYLTRAQRGQLSEDVHPLFATRGVPGTHDVPLLMRALQQLASPSAAVTDMPQKHLPIPRFNKATDDRHPLSRWSSCPLPVDIIVLEGWCLGARPQSDAALEAPINTLEREQDRQGIWRVAVNENLKQAYADLHAQVEHWVMLKAPSFEQVLAWRIEQEEKLRASLRDTSPVETGADGLMDASQIADFIAYYQRITEQLLIDLPGQVDDLYTLDSARQITAHRQPTASTAS